MRLKLLKINACRESLVPCLSVEAELENTETTPYTVFAVRGSLRLILKGEGSSHQRLLLADSGPLFLNDLIVPSSTSRRIDFQFLLAPWILERMEKHRQKDVHFSLLVQWFSAWKGQDPPILSDYRADSCWSDEYEAFEVPQSRWIDILKKLGFLKVKIFELPIPEVPSEDPFTKATDYLQKAQHSILQQNFKDVLTNCRQCHEELDTILKTYENQLRKELDLGCSPQRPGDKTRSEKFLETRTKIKQFCHMGPHAEYPVIEKKDAELALYTTLTAAKYLFESIKEIRQESS